MNQTNPHFTQWKNLSQEQKDAHDFDNYKYEWQADNGEFTFIYFSGEEDNNNIVYRLVIEDDKWYFSKYLGNPHVILGVEVKHQAETHKMPILRPATADEMPKVERAFKDGWYYPVMYKDGEYDMARYLVSHQFHTFTYNICNLKAFSWIGEGSKIDWGKDLEGKG